MTTEPTRVSTTLTFVWANVVGLAAKPATLAHANIKVVEILVGSLDRDSQRQSGPGWAAQPWQLA